MSSVLIVADPGDGAARALAADLGDRAILVVPADLSRPGWTYFPEPSRRTGASAAGPVRAADLGHVVVRLSAVFATHLLHVSAADRNYVAAEMTAFLRAWLIDLPFPMANQPSAVDLNGPGWAPEGWAAAAARVGVAHVPVRRAVPDLDGTRGEQAEVRVAVAGPHVEATESCDPQLAEQARAVVADAGVVLATVGFDARDSHGRVTDVDVRPDLMHPPVSRVLTRWLS